MDSAWAARRRTHLTVILAGVLLVSLAVYVYLQTYEPPTCFDNNTNQDEQGIDCGGSCSLLCPFQVEPVGVEWVRLFEVNPGSWTVVAYLQNNNTHAYTNDARYKFTLYDSSGNILGTREGTTFIGVESAFAVIEGKLVYEQGTPSRASFEWLEKPTYYAIESSPSMLVEGYELLPSVSGSEVRAMLRNKQPVPVNDVEIAFIAFDSNENAVAASKTYVEYLGPRSSQQLNFSWPAGLTVKPSRVEFIPREPIVK